MWFNVIVILIILKLFYYFTKGKCKSKRRLDGKTIIVTGANAGIGKATVADFARRGAKIIMACRNLELAYKARDEIISETGNKNIIVKKLDVSSLKSVREFSNDIIETEERLDILMHNAGVYMGGNHVETEDGIEMTMATHHFGPFLLTHLLLDLMKKSGPSRIVIVSSIITLYSFVNFEKIDFSSLVKRNSVYNYMVSKHANVLFTNELTKRLKGTHVTINSLHPGAVTTKIFDGLPIVLLLCLNAIKMLMFKTPEEGAQTQIYVAVDEQLEGVSGKYFIDCIGFTFSTSKKEIRNAKYLWDCSEVICKLNPEEKINY